MSLLEIALSISLSISLLYICYRECGLYICKKREKSTQTLIDDYPKNVFIRSNNIELVVSE